jgi:exopolysaccharide biosynthesis polyprenyl glycosylphosphotransferase
VGFLGDPPAGPATPWPYLGPISSVARVLHEGVIDEVAICLPPTEWSLVDDVITLCQDEGKIVRIPLEAPQIESGLRFVEDLDGTAVLSLVQGPDRAVSLWLKRCFDIVGATVGLVVLSPLLLGVTLYILARDGRPVLFRHTRVGMHGRPFTILKFRTMVRDAEERREEVAALNMIRGAAFKIDSDPRTTSWGHILRRTSIDELPQLWNVLRGDMSLVGPRPAPPREVEVYDVWHRRRLSMKPGMTGLWQVTARIDRDFDDRARLDLDYIDRWSLWLDLRIVAKTVSAVLQAEGR